MWEKLLSTVTEYISPLGLVAVMIVLNYQQNGQSNKNMVNIYQASRQEIADLSGAIKRLANLIETDKTEESRFDKVLAMYEVATQKQLTDESAIGRSTAAQQKVVDALEMIVKKLERNDEKLDILTLEVLKTNYSKELGK